MSDTTFRQLYPIDFTLFDRRNQPLLYIDNLQEGTLSEPLFLEVSNTSQKTIQLIGDKSGEEASSTHFHFQLNFRPGVLFTSTTKTPALVDSGWSFATSKRKDGGDSLYFLKQENMSLAPNDSLRLSLEGLTADPTKGARGTKIQLMYGKMNYSGSNTPLEGIRSQHMSIANHSGQREIPLFFGVVGSSKILNDGTTDNKLTLRLSNTSDDTTITLQSGDGETPATNLVFSFSEGESQEEWALCTSGQANAINVTIQEGKIKKAAGGESSQWIFTPKKDISLAPGGYLDIFISHIVTDYPSGPTPVYLYYNDIPGYWDGKKMAFIEKAPLLYRGAKVGIGTDEPKATLDVCGDVVIKKNLGVGKASPGPKIFAAGSVRASQEETESNYTEIAHEGSNGYINTAGEGNLDFRHDGKTLMSLTENGRLGIGTSTPTKPLEVVGEGKINGTLSVGGSLGVGTTTPTLPLDVKGAGTFSGPLGVGTATPKASLSVVGTVRAACEPSEKNYTETGHGGAHGYINTVGAGRLDFRHDGLNRMTLTDQGRLGIGTDSPSSTLHVNGTASITGGLTPHYDSGWFNVNANAHYNKTHNLGTQFCQVQLFFRETEWKTVWAASPETTLANKCGCFLYMKDNNHVEICFADNGVYCCDNSSTFGGGDEGKKWGSGQYRIFLWKIAV